MGTLRHAYSSTSAPSYHELALLLLSSVADRVHSRMCRRQQDLQQCCPSPVEGSIVALPDAGHGAIYIMSMQHSETRVACQLMWPIHDSLEFAEKSHAASIGANVLWCTSSMLAHIRHEPGLDKQRSSWSLTHIFRQHICCPSVDTQRGGR